MASHSVALAAAHVKHKHEVDFSEKAQAELANIDGMGGTDSFELWQAQLMGPAKPEPGVWHLSVIPLKSLRGQWRRGQ